MSAYKGERYNRIRSTKAWSPGNPITSGFYRATVKKVTAVSSGTLPSKIEVDTDLGHSNVEVTDFVGSPPVVGDDVWVTFCESRPDDVLLVNTQHQNDDNFYNGVVRFGGQTEQNAVTLKIDPTSHPDSQRASMRLNETIMGTDTYANKTEGDWYVYDHANTQWNLRHTGHSEETNGGLTITATGTHTQGSAGTHVRYFSFYPSYDWSGYERGGFFLDNQYQDFTFFGHTYQYACHPLQDNQYTLGYAAARWAEVFAANGTINTSDRSQKTDIVDSDLGLDFLKALRPVKFKWIKTEGRSGVRTHYGLIGQEVETVLGDAASDTAIWTNSLIEAHPEMEGDSELNVPHIAAVEEHYEQGLRYTELIAPIIKAIQELEARVAALES